MSRKVETCAVLTFFIMPSLCLAQDLPEITISVHDYTNVSTEVLANAESEARRVFHQAGVETTWLNCPPKLEKTEPVGCYLGDVTHLVLKVLPHGPPPGDRIDGLGIALLDEKGTGYCAWVFYDRVRELAESRKLGHALLAEVFVHEIGHLLLGSNSHSMSGIMCPHWSEQELKKISQGGMFFAPSQSKMMRDRLGSGRRSRVPGGNS